MALLPTLSQPSTFFGNRPLRLLYIDMYPPLYDRNSGHVRVHHMLKLLRQDGHNVSHLSVIQMTGTDRAYYEELRRLGIAVIDGDSERCREFGIETTQPPIDLPKLFGDNNFDAIIMNAYEIAHHYMPILRAHAPNARAIVDTCDIATVRFAREAKLVGSPEAKAHADRVAAIESRVFREADELIAITTVECNYLQERFPDKAVTVLPNIHELTDAIPPFGIRNGLLFVGNFWHHANGPAVEWFCENVLPVVRLQRPDIVLHVVGQSPPESIQKYEGQHVHIHGWVPNLEPFFAQCRVSIAPLTFGAGMKGKVGEALAAGLPVVTTSIGAEGMELTNGKNASIADDAEAFAQAVLDVYNNNDVWENLSKNGRQHVAHHFTPNFARASLRNLFSPCSRANAYMVAFPDWQHNDEVETLLATYVHEHGTCRECELALFAIEDRTSVEYATHQLLRAIDAIGLHPDTMPHVSLSPMSLSSLSELPADAIWIDLLHPAADCPNHLMNNEQRFVKKQRINGVLS